MSITPKDVVNVAIRDITQAIDEATRAHVRVAELTAQLEAAQLHAQRCAYRASELVRETLNHSIDLTGPFAPTMSTPKPVSR